MKTDRHAWDILADVSGEDNAEEFKQLSVELQLKYVRMAVEKGVSMRQASRLSILSYSKIQRELSCRKVNQRATADTDDVETPLAPEHLLERKNIGPHKGEPDLFWRRRNRPLGSILGCGFTCLLSPPSTDEIAN